MIQTSLETIFASRPSFDSTQCFELLYNASRRSTLHDPTLFESMASDTTKKKIESLRESISKLETQKILAKGNKAKMDSILRMIARFEKDIETLKKL
jgi:hypothetical protein